MKSNLHMLAHDDRGSIAEMHKYFDYSMREKITSINKTTNKNEFKGWKTKVNDPVLY